MPQRSPRPQLSPVTIAAGAGSAVGTAIFLICALLAYAGSHHAAAFAAQSGLVLALMGVAVITVTPRRSARMQRIRVPVSRAIPQAWWPREPDLAPIMAACVGAPVVVGAAAAYLLFG